MVLIKNFEDVHKKDILVLNSDGDIVVTMYAGMNKESFDLLSRLPTFFSEEAIDRYVYGFIIIGHLKKLDEGQSVLGSITDDDVSKEILSKGTVCMNIIVTLPLMTMISEQKVYKVERKYDNVEVGYLNSILQQGEITKYE